MKNLLKKLKYKNTKIQIHKNILKKAAWGNIIWLLLFTLLFLAPSFEAKADNMNRIRQCTAPSSANSTTEPKPIGLDYNINNGGEDFEFDPINRYCMEIVLPEYLALKLTIPKMNSSCGTGTRGVRLLPSPIHDAWDISKATIACGVKLNGACCGAVAVGAAELGSFLAAIRIQHDVAQDAYDNTALCGGGLDRNWMRWNATSLSRDFPDEKAKVESVIKGWAANCKAGTTADCTKLSDGLVRPEYREWYYGGIEEEDSGPDACPDVTRAITTDSNGNKIDSQASYTSAEAGFTYPFPTQRYYMRGTDAGNYACERFNYRANKGDPLKTGTPPLSEGRKKDYQYAYDCCVNKSKTSICIERKYCSVGGFVSACALPASNIVTSHKFCTAGTECRIGSTIDITTPVASTSTSVNTVAYAANYEEDNRLICAHSSNLCPYDFNIGGGSTTCDFYQDGVKAPDSNFITPISTQNIKDHDCQTRSDIRNPDCSFNKFAGKCRNYCQYLNHCVVVGGNQNTYESGIDSPYFSKACLDFVGDSKNEYGFGVQATLTTTGVQKHFSAPIAQCVRETLENVFYNRAGHTQCSNVNEYPDENGNCFTNAYNYKQGVPLTTESFFSYIQDHVRDAIKIVLTLSIVMQGFKMLLTGTPFKHQEIIMYVVKMGLVLFFATGTAWQGFFFDGVYNASATFSTIVMNIKTSSIEEQRDGCQFGKISLENGSSMVISGEYPLGKEYLAVFDTFDCKISRYLGFGPSATVSTLVSLIIPALISPALGAIGIFFAVFTMMFGIFMIIAAFRALHIFLTSAFAIILLVYISPITITCVLFKKTTDMFDTWLNSFIGYSLQPVLLFAYIGLFMTVFETLVTGSATFTGKAPTKEIVCDKRCLKQDGTLITMGTDDGLGGTTMSSAQECNDTGDKVLDPMSDSVACMMNLKNEKFGSIPILAPLGVSLPILKDFFSENGRVKILSMLKALLVIYILLGFIDEIPGLTANLMGGGDMPTHKLNAMSIAGKAAFILQAIQKRGAGGAKKLGGAVASRGGGAGKGMADFANKIKSGDDKPPSGGGSGGGSTNSSA